MFSIQYLLDQVSELHRTSYLKTLVSWSRLIMVVYWPTLDEGRTARWPCVSSIWDFDPGAGGVGSELAHILPSSIGYLSQRPNALDIHCNFKTETHQVIESFTGMRVDSALILCCIYLPENAFLLQYDAHQSFHQYFGWGIEAITGRDTKVRSRPSCVFPQFQFFFFIPLCFPDTLFHLSC